MKMSISTKSMILTGLMCLTINQTQASEDLVPEVNPSSDCQSHEVLTPGDGFPEYRYLRDSNCHAVFILPESRVKPEVHFSSSGHLGLCKGVKINIERQNKMEAAIADLRVKRIEIVEKLLEATKDSEIKKYENKLAIIGREEGILKELRNDDKVYLDQEYGKVEGGHFELFLDSRINPQDMLMIGAYNKYSEEVTDSKGNKKTVRIAPVVSPAPVAESYYSFRLRSHSPDNPQYPEIMETDIPGFEKLSQIDSNAKYTHIVAGDVLSGEMLVNLPSVCERVEEVSSGVYQLTKEGREKMFAINRTMVVNRRFSYGYTAELDSREIATKITEDYVSKSGNGSSVYQVFDQDLSSYLESALSFKWHENFTTQNTAITTNEILNLQKAAFARLVSDYYQALVQSGKLKPQLPIDSGEGKPVTTEEFSKGWGCGPVYISGIKFDHDRCGAYDFTLVTYHSGVTDKEIKDSLTLGENLSERFEAQSLAPFYYTTGFTFAEKQN